MADITASSKKWPKLFNNWKWVVLFLTAGLILGSYKELLNQTSFMFLPGQIFNNPMVIVYHDFAALFITVAVMKSNFLQELLTKKFPLFLGRISFSMYSIHMIFIGTLTCLTFLFLYHRGFGYTLSVFISSIITICVVFIFSHFMEKYVDRLSIKLGDKFANLFINKSEIKEVLFTPVAK